MLTCVDLYFWSNQHFVLFGVNMRSTRFSLFYDSSTPFFNIFYVDLCAPAQDNGNDITHNYDIKYTYEEALDRLGKAKLKEKGVTESLFNNLKLRIDQRIVNIEMKDIVVPFSNDILTQGVGTVYDGDSILTTSSSSNIYIGSNSGELYGLNITNTKKIFYNIFLL